MPPPWDFTPTLPWSLSTTASHSEVIRFPEVRAPAPKAQGPLRHSLELVEWVLVPSSLP